LQQESTFGEKSRIENWSIVGNLRSNKPWVKSVQTWSTAPSHAAHAPRRLRSIGFRAAQTQHIHRLRVRGPEGPARTRSTTSPNRATLVTAESRMSVEIGTRLRRYGTKSLRRCTRGYTSHVSAQQLSSAQRAAIASPPRLIKLIRLCPRRSCCPTPPQPRFSHIHPSLPSVHACPRGSAPIPFPFLAADAPWQPKLRHCPGSQHHSVNPAPCAAHNAGSSGSEVPFRTTPPISPEVCPPR
jgi:hypothetical protein